LKKIIEGIYQIIFNWQSKKKGVSSISHFIAGGLTGYLVVILLLDVYLIVTYITHKRFYFDDSNRGFMLVYILLYNILNYLIMFKWLKFDKRGTSEQSLFEIPDDVRKISTRVLYVALTIIIIMFLIDSIFFSKKVITPL
jgi:hypothetical protein